MTNNSNREKMKNKLTTLLLALCAVALTGCKRENMRKDYGFDVYDSIQTVDYKGHRYIVYKGYRKGGITHDPDCPCHKTNSER